MKIPVFKIKYWNFFIKKLFVRVFYFNFFIKKLDLKTFPYYNIIKVLIYLYLRNVRGN